MPTIANAPLIETIFELRWGQLANNSFQYSNEEQSLFPGRVSAAALAKGYGHLETLKAPNQPVLPQIVTHRFRQGENLWPCFQTGLGIFTVNQNDKGYLWEDFKEAIASGMDVFQEARNNQLENIQDSLTIILRYQDGFYPESESTLAYLEKNFKIDIKLPTDFTNETRINSRQSNINMRIELETTDPKGLIAVVIAKATINERPGILMETVVQSKATEAIKSNINTRTLTEWAESAHKLQQHAFANLINKSAYS